MIKALATLLLTFTFVSAFTQGTRIDYFPDSIRVELPQHEGLVIFEMNNYVRDKLSLTDFPTMLKRLLSYTEKSLPDGFRENGPYDIQVKVTHEDEDMITGFGEYNFRRIGEKTLITITKNEVEQTEVRVKKEKIVELVPPGWTITIKARQFTVHVYAAEFKGLQGISNEDFRQVSTRIDEHLSTAFLGRRSIQSRTILNESSIASDTISYRHPLDMLAINAEGGVGILNTRIYPELSATLSIWRYDRYNRPRTKFQLHYDNLFFAEARPEGGYNSYINSFLGVSVGMNFRKDTGAARWTGIGASFLVRESGDYFQGNTMKLFLFNDVGNTRLQIMPEFYLTDDFKKFNFGMKLKYVF